MPAQSAQRTVATDRRALLIGSLWLALLAGCSLAPDRTVTTAATPAAPDKQSPGPPAVSPRPPITPGVAGVQSSAVDMIRTQVAVEAPTATAAAAAGRPLPLPVQSTAATAPTRPASPRSTPTPESGRYLGRDPLPAGADLSDGPFLTQLRTQGAAGVGLGDGGLGNAITAAYLAAVQAEQEALTTLDTSRLPDHFAGPALADLRARIAGARADQAPRTVVRYQPRVMKFIPLSSGLTFTLTDARTETTWPAVTSGSAGATAGPGETARECYLASLRWQAGRWLVEGLARQHGGPQGKYCPGGWS
jgi:hypothetical protein